MLPVNIRDKAISYEGALIIKAIGVLLMVFHHCFAFPEWHIAPPVYGGNAYKLVILARAVKICVPVFAFLTGWTYFHHADKSVRYSAKKILTLLCDYWIIVIPISIFAVLFCQYQYSIDSLGELFPFLPHPLMLFAWYVWFYVLMMAVFPIFGLLESPQKKPWKYLAFIILLGGVMIGAKNAPSGWNELWYWYPSAISGYFIAKFRILELVTSRIKSKISALILGPILIAAALYINLYYGKTFLNQHTGFVSAPLFIIGVLLLHTLFPTKKLWGPLVYIGGYAMNIWFIHGIFYSPITKSVVQSAAFFRNTPVWIFGATFFISLILSILMRPIQQYVSKQLLPHLFSILKL